MPGTVYLIDDDNGFRGSLAQILGSLGLDCQEWDSPEEVIALAAFQRPGCVVLDYRLPSLSGLEVLKEIRRKSTIPVILISAYADVKLSVAAMQAGAAGVFEKPLDDNEFLSAVEQLCFADREFAAKRQACRAIQDTLRSLSGAEQETLALMLRGLTSKAIANDLGKSIKSVERHRKTLMGKLGVATGIEVILKVSACPLNLNTPLSCLDRPCSRASYSLN